MHHIGTQEYVYVQLYDWIFNANDEIERTRQKALAKFTSFEFRCY